MSGFNNKEIKILKETENAFFMCYTKVVKRGTSMVNDFQEFTFWCPKSVWFDEKYFTNGGHNHNPKNGSVIFNAPNFLKL